MSELPELLKILLVCYLVACALFWQACAHWLWPLLRQRLRERRDHSLPLQEVVTRLARIEARLDAATSPSREV